MRNLEDFCLDVFIYKYPGALHLCTPGQTFIYKYYGATHLFIPYQNISTIMMVLRTLLVYSIQLNSKLFVKIFGLFKAAELQNICRDA
jgi:hypothetical protein